MAGFRDFGKGFAVGGAAQAVTEIEKRGRKNGKNGENGKNGKKKKNGQNGQNGLPDAETLEDYVGLNTPHFTNGSRRGIYGGI